VIASNCKPVLETVHKKARSVSRECHFNWLSQNATVGVVLWVMKNRRNEDVEFCG
jgi:hypothetical protein